MGCNTSKEANAAPPPPPVVENGTAGGVNGANAKGRNNGAGNNGAGSNNGVARCGGVGGAAPGAKGVNEGADAEQEEEEEAAIKIQAAFRGHQARKAMRSGTGDEDEQAKADERAALEAEFNPEDQELCHAATKIQASFRGHMARKQVTKGGKTDDELSKEMGKLDAKGDEVDDELADIDLNDPELNKAATKIQASFRGHRVRKDTGGDAKEEEEGNE